MEETVKRHKIAIVDTGVDLKNHKLIQKINGKLEGIWFHKDGDSDINYISTDDDKKCIQDYIGHGTAILGILLEHNTEIDLLIVKIYDSGEDEADQNVLIYALQYVYENTDCDIINLSLGLSYMENSERLYTICSKFRKDNRIIVSAFENAGALSFPAEFENVIGVSSGETCYNKNDYCWVKNSPVNVLAKGRNQRIYWLENRCIFGYGNSYACAHFSGILSTYFGDYYSEEWNSWVTAQSKAVIETKNGEDDVGRNPIMNYKKAVIFPFNKEMHSLVRFSDLLGFELVDVYETKYSALVSAYTDDILKEKCKRNYRIKNIDDIDLDSFDTFILGHTEEYFTALNQHFMRAELVNLILDNEKYLYTLDDVDELVKNDEKRLKYVFHPAVRNDNILINRFGKLYRIGQPVLGIFGTSSKQGKFTLQLKLRREFITAGYRLAQIGTEPTSLLYGMDAAFPVGYNASVEIYQYDVISYLNNLLWHIAKESDIVMIGGQSGIIPQDVGNVSYFNFSSLELIFALMPDAIILCVNASDGLEIIHRTKQFLESASGGKVLAVVVFPMYYQTEGYVYPRLVQLTCQKYDEVKKEIESKLHVPVYLLSKDMDIHFLYENIIDFFAGDE